MELLWIGVAFVLGYGAKRLGQPPLIGFLAAGFALEVIGFRPNASLEELADLGVLILLFTIGLKLDLRSVIQPVVWGTTLAHMILTTLGIGALAYGLGQLGVGAFSGLSPVAAAILAFALSFSSTIFAVKLLEERDDTTAVYGKVSVGVLVVQDLAAVVFMAATAGVAPSPWSLALLGLIPLRPLLHRLLASAGHGELLVLSGVAATLGGAGLFAAVGLKADLGALVAGVVLGGHPKSEELSKSLYGLKDLFLVGFFLTVGLTGLPTVSSVVVASGLVLLVPLKGVLFFGLGTRFRLRARSAWFSAVALSQFSEFGLIVGAVAVKRGFLPKSWLVTIAIALALSFLLSSLLNRFGYALYRRLRGALGRFERARRLPAEEAVDARDAEVLVFGMGRVGQGAYDHLTQGTDLVVVGFDIDPDTVAAHQAAGRRVLVGSATDPDVWQRLHVDRDRVRMVLLAMSSFFDNRTAIEQHRAESFPGLICVASTYQDQVEALREAGADAAYNVFAEAGAGLARHAIEQLAVPAAATR
ncbi:MAG: cation:proton antiporter family protein [Myxococcota bacterium]